MKFLFQDSEIVFQAPKTDDQDKIFESNLLLWTNQWYQNLFGPFQDSEMTSQSALSDLLLSKSIHCVFHEMLQGISKLWNNISTPYIPQQMCSAIGRGAQRLRFTYLVKKKLISRLWNSLASTKNRWPEYNYLVISVSVDKSMIWKSVWSISRLWNGITNCFEWSFTF